MKKITKVHFDERTMWLNHVIDFSIEELDYFIRYQHEENGIVPKQVVHYNGKGVCPFCKKNIIERDICYAITYAEKELHALFQQLIYHPSVRLKLLLLGLLPKREMEK